jgi:hypothetical protein
MTECLACDELAIAGSEFCERCTDWMAQEGAQMQAQHERRQRLRQAREERSR